MSYIRTLKNNGGLIAKPPAFKKDKNNMSAKIHSLPLRQTTHSSNYNFFTVGSASFLKLTAMLPREGTKKCPQSLPRHHRMFLYVLRIDSYAQPGAGWYFNYTINAG